MDFLTITRTHSWLAVALFITLIFAYTRRWSSKKQPNLPPGPKPWPVIGNLNLISSLPHQSLHHLSKQYGPLMHLRFGSFPVVVASSVEMAKTFLTTQDLNFSDRPKFASGKYTTYNYSDITWSDYGPYWRQARKMCVLELLSSKRIESYEYIRKEEMKAILHGLYKLENKEVLIRNPLSILSLDVISRMVLGKKYTDESENAIVSPNEFQRMVEELFLLNGVLNIGDSIPWLDFLDLQSYIKRMKILSKKLDKVLEHILTEHEDRRRKANESFVANDMLDVLLEYADNPELDVKLERDGVKAFTQDLLTGGTESSTITLEWALTELLRSPHVVKKAVEELERVIGNGRWVDEKDMPNLPYIQAIVKETMRLHPVGPLISPRVSRYDCKINGYDILKGTRILVNVWSIGRDPSIWENPNEFYPDRFIGKSIDVKGHDFELLPFGSGRRMCPGYNLGLKIIESSLANLLHGFNWKMPENLSPDDLNMEEIFGLSMPKKFPLKVVIEPRLQEYLYRM